MELHMSFRTAAFACIGAMMAAVVPPAFADTDQSSCAATSVRVYFEHGSDALSPMAMDTLNAAARAMAGCGHGALRVAVDASDPRAMGRGEAIRAAMAGQDWEIRLEPRMMTRVAALASPDFVAVTMTPDSLPAAPLAPALTAQAGV
jgi:hypothetical protein